MLSLCCITQGHRTLAMPLHLMFAKRYKVELTLVQRKALERLVKTGATKPFTRQRAQIWLRVDQGPHGPADSRLRPGRGCGIGHQPRNRGTGPAGVRAGGNGAGAAAQAPGSPSAELVQLARHAGLWPCWQSSGWHCRW